MYQFEIEGCLDFNETIKIIETLEVEQKIKCLMNTEEHLIYIQYEWEKELVAKSFKENSIKFYSYKLRI